MRLFESNKFVFRGFVGCIAFLLFLNTSLFAAEYGFDIWTTAEGLPQNTVNGLAQTPDGYLWLATFDGLARFDGVRFKIFDKGNTKGIVNNRFAGIFADKDGAIWAWTENSILTIYQHGVFTSYSTPEALREGITGIAADAEGKARIITSENNYYFDDGKLILAPDRKIRDQQTFYFGKSGAKWSFTSDEISQYKDGIVTRYPLKLDPQALQNTSSLVPYEDSQGALWITLNTPLTYQLFRLKDGAMTVFTDKEIPELKDTLPYPITEESDGSLWFHFVNLTKEKFPNTFVHLKNGSFSTWRAKESVEIRQSLIDHEGNFWLATYQGLKRFRRQLITTLSEKDGLDSNEVYPLLQTSNGDILIGTDKNLNRYADGKITNFGLKKPNPNKNFTLRGLWEDENQRIWLGSYFGSGWLENKTLKAVIPIDATDFAVDSEGNVWLATNKGLYKYKEDKEIAHYTIENGLPHNEVITIHFDRHGNLWLGTFDGLAQLKDDKVVNFNDAENSPKGFVRYIYEDAEGVLWFGTYGDGLVRYKDGNFFNYRVEDGLFNNGVFAILEDHRSNFWMSSNRGIHRVSRQELNDFADGKIPKLNSVSYDEKDGMQTAECNGGRIPAAIKTKDGKLWFPTMGGVAIVDPEAEKLNPTSPLVVIENIVIDRKPFDLQSSPTKAELKAGQSNIAIEYTGLSLTKSEQVKFRYKLEGIEENWIEAGTNRTANYSYLPHGEYTFRVIAANADGVWNNQGATIKIIVHPFYYQTWWFRGLLTLMIAVIIGFIYHYRMKNLRKIAEAQSEFSRRLIESQEAERKRIASELHDGLGQSLAIISNRARMGKINRKNREIMLHEFDEISQNALEALDEVQQITSNLHPQYLERLGLTKALKAMFAKLADVIELNSEIDLIDNIFPKEAEINVYRVVQESLNNVIKHSDASEAEIKIKKVANEVIMTIKDDGRGFDTTNFKAKGTGLGLVGLRERTKMLGGKISINSSIGNGTEIRVNLPIKI